MKRFLRSEAGAIVLWFVAALVVAAVLAPLLYRAGMGLAEATAARDLPAAVEWLGRACGRADFGRYFSRAMAISALGLLPWLFRRMRRLRAAGGSAGVPCESVAWPSALLQLAAGLVIAGGLLWGLGLTLDALGAYVAKGDPVKTGKLLSKAVVPAAIVAPLEEWLIRGLLLGLWLGFARPAAACLWTSALYAFVHFLGLPDGAVIADPAAPWAGFELLGKVFSNIASPVFFVTDFATLFAIGMILAWARVRTRALWFSTGLHAGWIFAFKGFNLFYKDVPGHALRPWGVGDSLRSGVLPMLTVALTAVACHFVLKRFDRPSGNR